MRLCFKLLDIDQDGYLNILNLLHLYKNVKTNSIIGNEILTVIEYFLRMNVYQRSVREKVEINFEVFHKTVSGRFSMKEEIRKKFLGIDMKPGDAESDNILPMEELRNRPDFNNTSEPLSIFAEYSKA